MTEPVGPHVPLSSRRKRTIQVARDSDTTPPPVEEFIVFVAECSLGQATRMFKVPTRQLEDELMELDHLLDDPKAEHAFDDRPDTGVVARIGRRLGLVCEADDDGELAMYEERGSSCTGMIRCVIRGSCDQ